MGPPTREESLSARRERYRSPDVTLHVYDLGPRIAGVNNMLALMGSGAYHAGVEIFGSEWSFGGERADATSESGVFFCAPRGCTAHIFRESVPMGRTPMSMREVHDLLKRMMDEWLSHEYDPLRRNCCHFADALCQALGVGCIPSWITSLANVGAMLWKGPSLAVRSVGGSVGGTQFAVNRAAGKEDGDGIFDAPFSSRSSGAPRERSVPVRSHAEGAGHPVAGIPRSRSLSVNPRNDGRSGWQSPLSCAFVQPSARSAQSPTPTAPLGPGMRSPSRGASPHAPPVHSRWLMSCASAAPQVTPRSPLQLPPQSLNQNLSEEEIACEVLRLRALKRSHDEVRGRLDVAEERLSSLPTHTVIKLHVYLERHFADPSLPAVQDALIKQLECLFTICHIDYRGPESLLDSSRQLFRDPQCFTSRLCGILLSSDDAKGLAPYLLANVQYRKMKDKDVNACFDAIHEWISAKYWFAGIADEVARVAAELDKQENLLAQMRGQAGFNEAPYRTMGPSPGPVSTPHTQNTGGATNCSEQSRIRSMSPSHFQRAVSIGNAVLRAMSGSPVGAMFRSRRPPGAGGPQDVDSSSRSYVGTPVSNYSGPPVSGRSFMDRQQTVPTTLLENMHQASRHAGPAKTPGSKAGRVAAERGRAPWRGGRV